MKNQSGSAAVELALVLPLLLLVLFGTVEYGTMMYDQAIITNAAREGARAGIVAVTGGGASDGITTSQNVALSYCSNNLITFGSSPTLSAVGTDVGSCSSPPGPACQLTVKVTYHYQGLGLGPLVALPLNQTLQATSVMYYE